MKTKTMASSALLVVTLSMTMALAQAAGGDSSSSSSVATTRNMERVTVTAKKKQKGGLIGNSYGSQMEQVTDNSIRVTTRKKVQGTLDEINTPGSTVNKAFEQIKAATIVRAAVEASNLGFKAIRASGTRDLSQTNEKRSASMCPGGICESSFTFAQGHYTTDVELAIEVTFDMYKDAPKDGQGYIDVTQVMQQYGL